MMDEKETKSYVAMLKNGNYQKEQFLKHIWKIATDHSFPPEERIDRITESVKLSGIYIAKEEFPS